jgi:hypothetical protein
MQYVLFSVLELKSKINDIATLIIMIELSSLGLFIE